MPEAIILAGPNGAGKTTFADEYFEDAERFVFVNADEVARELRHLTLPQAQFDIRAARIMLERIDALIGNAVDFMFETTLASLTYARKIPAWRERDYVVSLIYLQLPSVEDSIARVRRRVEAGGHGIPEETIRRRFNRSRTYWEEIYKPLVDEWYLYDSVDGDFVRTDWWLNDTR